MQFFGVNESKIRWTVLEKKFMKRKNFDKNQEPQNQKFGLRNLEKIIKIEKKICNFLVQMNQKFDGLFLRKNSFIVHGHQKI